MIGFIGDLRKSAVFGIDEPNIVTGQFAFAGPVAGEGDGFTVRTVTWLHVPSHSFGKLFGVDAVGAVRSIDWHTVEVA